MMNKLSLSLITLFAAAACQTKAAEAPAVASAQPVAPSSRPGSQPDSRPAPKPQAEGAAAEREADWTTGPVHRGAPFSVEAETELSAVLGKPSEFAGKTVKVSGEVTRACSKKGCWMELRADASEAGVRITFKDYGFFVPLDSAGAKATVEGTVKVEQLSAEHVEHLAAEGAQVKKNDKGEATEIGLVATAVTLQKRPSSAAK